MSTTPADARHLAAVLVTLRSGHRGGDHLFAFRQDLEGAAGMLEVLRDAVFNALNRTQTDPEFRWHMLGTETFDLLIRAEAACTGRPEAEIRRARETDRQPEYRRREPECALNRGRVSDLERLLEENGIPIPERR